MVEVKCVTISKTAEYMFTIFIEVMAHMIRLCVSYIVNENVNIILVAVRLTGKRDVSCFPHH